MAGKKAAGKKAAGKQVAKAPAPSKEVAARAAARQAKAERAEALRTMLPGSADHERLVGDLRRADTGAVRLAQIVNLHIAGWSLTDIADAIGATAEEVDRLLQRESARYVRNQPTLRTYVRNWISERYSRMLDANWDAATDPHHPQRLENQDRAIRILSEMAKLHGAPAPTQTEVKVETAPAAVDALVQRLAQTQALDYDDTIFDVVDAEVVEDMVAEAEEATRVSGNAVEQPQPEDEEGQ